MARHKIKKSSPAERTDITILELLAEKINIRRLLDSVYLKEEKLIEAALDQPKLILRAGTLRVQKLHQRNLFETRLDAARAASGLRLRRIRDAGGKKEFTEGAVKERIELDPEVKKYRQRVDKAIAEEEFTKLLQEVFRTRSDALRVIVQAGKTSVHAKELELLRKNKTLARQVVNLRNRWDREED